MRTATEHLPSRSRVFTPIGLLERLLCCAFIVGLIPPHVGQAAEDREGVRAENRERLRAMPREQRLALREKLSEYDALSRSERAAIRSLDERIGELPPAERANYGSVLRRYHLWVQGLTDRQRDELKATPPGERMRLVTKLRAEERKAPNPNTTPLFLQVIEFSPLSPFETAHRLKVWFDLTPEKRTEIEKIPSSVDQQRRLAELSQEVKPGPVPRLTKEEEDALMARIEANPQLKNWLAYPLKKADPTKHEKVRRRMAANYYFLEHPPAAVAPSNLVRFESALPTWYREQFDHLPPEEARRRLTILYRLIFLAGEMPEPRKATNAPRPATAPPAASPRPSSPSEPKRTDSRPGENPF